MLTTQQKDEICYVIQSGCDRETAAKHAGTTWAALHAAMAADREFAIRLRQTEAKVELRQMLQLQEASKKESNWRISVWWLESLAPNRYGRHASGMLTSRQFKIFIEHVATSLVAEIKNENDRERVFERLHSIAQRLDSFLRDECLIDENLADIAIHDGEEQLIDDQLDDPIDAAANDDDTDDFTFTCNGHGS